MSDSLARYKVMLHVLAPTALAVERLAADPRRRRQTLPDCPSEVPSNDPEDVLIMSDMDGGGLPSRSNTLSRSGNRNGIVHLGRAENCMKRGISMLLVVLFVSACAETRKDWTVTGGGQSKGIVELSYQYKEFEKPHTEDAQAQAVANSACHEWGYSNSRPFGRPLKNCNQQGGFFEDCASWTVSRQYQCIGAASH